MLLLCLGLILLVVLVVKYFRPARWILEYLTQEERDWILFRDVKPGAIIRPPAFPFTICDPDTGKVYQIPTPPVDTAGYLHVIGPAKSARKILCKIVNVNTMTETAPVEVYEIDLRIRPLSESLFLSMLALPKMLWRAIRRKKVT